ncbi:hypothetical protein NL676_002053 [Syzygium grande]|nr:hypothetical protein NL676_002053 [Syzygium grande]
MAILLWLIWKARNDFVFRGKPPIPSSIIESSRHILQNYRKWNHQNARQRAEHDPLLSAEQNPSSRYWKPPKRNCFKLNIDGSYLEDAAAGAVSGILRNEAGSLLDSFAKTVPANSPLHTELQALLHALSFLIDRRSQEIVIETDCLEMVKKLYSQTEVGWEEECFFKEVHLRRCTAKRFSSRKLKNFMV